MNAMAAEMTRADGSADQDTRWRAVVARDSSADGTFVYSVRSTGVYCRPSCPARLAKRANVQFHATCEDAERAGFRPCKRCRPDQPALAQRRAAVVATACRMIEAAAEPPELDRIAQAAGMSRFHFHRIFKAATGVTPKAYGEAHRARKLQAKLAGSASVTEAIYDAGFNSAGRFYAASAGRLGMTPAQWRAARAEQRRCQAEQLKQHRFRHTRTKFLQELEARWAAAIPRTGLLPERTLPLP